MEPQPGRFFLTCRTGFESHLVEELTLQKISARMLGPAMVEATRAPKAEPAFARMGFAVEGTLRGAYTDWVTPLVSRLRPTAAKTPLHIQVWTLDTDDANRRAVEADSLRTALVEGLGPSAVLGTAAQARDMGGRLVQVCLWGRNQATWGSVLPNEALSLAPGGRQRMRREEDSPSRAALKIDEALELFGIEPGKGEVCVDLGAAPGGWTQRLLSRGARVIAIDPGALKPDIAKHPKLKHVKGSAFGFAPEDPVDWLLCDMAWRPLEVAQLLSKWGRNGWATYLVANLKLPMQDKVHWLNRIRGVLEQDGGWRHLRMRQLYHDRDEVTVLAHHVPG